MPRRLLPTVSTIAFLVFLRPPVTSAQRPPSAPPIRTTAASPASQRFLSPASPLELVAARTVDRIAWTAFEEGKRNAYTAAAPAFVPIRLTSFLADNGIDLSGIRISDDGSTVVFVRGTAPNRDGWVANPNADPAGPERVVWAARTAGGPAFRVVADAGNPALAPDGSSVLFVREGQIHRARVAPVRPASEMDRGEKPFIRQWGVQSGPKWSPDGRKIAFVSTRTDHSFIVIYDMATRSVKYMSPGVDFDTTPLWSRDSRTIYGDDDRNVAFQQTTGLVQLLRQRDVHYELIVFPDDTHESMLHSRWLYTLDRMEKFLATFLKGTSPPTPPSAFRH